MAVLRLSFLGTFAVQRDDVPITTFRGDKVRALLAYLAMESVRSHARGSLAGLFWPEQPQDAALNNLSQALGRLRAALGSVEPPMLLLTRQAVGWNTASTAAVDVTTFVRLAQSTAIADLEAAAALYGGPFLPGFALPGCEEFEEWLALTREHLDRLAVGALDTLARAYLEARSYAAAEAAARRQLALDPWRESAHRQVMEALAGAGRRAAALAHYAACRRALQDGLDVAPDAATTALYERLRAETAAPEDAAAPAADTLPVALTPLVGREADLAALGALLRAEGVRLLTLVGAGGMGKTRLALELARAQRAAFGDGVFLVSLAPLADAAAILPALAATLRVTTPAGDLRQTVLHALRGKHLLLVLDNFEHLLDGAELVVDLLQAAPRVRIIATSREPLAVRGEHVYGVQGLAYAAGAAPAAATAAPAVRLFVQAARRARADFTPRPADLAAILRICALVRGMPLGLEMAAAWIGLLAPEEIAQEIARGADILAADWPDAPERQRSMRAVFAWSWALLDDAGRGALRRLSVFRGGFTRAAAEQVAGAPLGALAALVRASLVARRPGEAGRYEIHELLRQFAAEELDAVPGEHAAVEARHGAYYLALAEAAEAEYAGPRQVAWLDRLEPDHDNIRAAQEWAARGGHAGAAAGGGGGLLLVPARLPRRGACAPAARAGAAGGAGAERGARPGAQRRGLLRVGRRRSRRGARRARRGGPDRACDRGPADARLRAVLPWRGGQRPARLPGRGGAIGGEPDDLARAGRRQPGPLADVPRRRGARPSRASPRARRVRRERGPAARGGERQPAAVSGAPPGLPGAGGRRPRAGRGVLRGEPAAQPGGGRSPRAGRRAGGHRRGGARPRAVGPPCPAARRDRGAPARGRDAPPPVRPGALRSVRRRPARPPRRSDARPRLGGGAGALARAGDGVRAGGGTGTGAGGRGTCPCAGRLEGPPSTATTV